MNPSTRRHATTGAALALIALAPLTACDDGSGLDYHSVTVQGTVVGQGNAPVEGVWVHLLAGPQGSPRPVTADDTDVGGAYAISTEVDPADCNDLHLRVLETETFDASAEPLASSLLGSCGDLEVDLIVNVEPPLPG